jgi:hypothetical protein
MEKDNSMHHIENQRQKDLDYTLNLNQLWDESSGENIDKLRAFTRHVPYTELSKFVLKYELFKKIVNTNGSIIECGVFNGNGLFTWATLSSILEPVNHTRKIIGFDTFEGFPSINEKDISDRNTLLKKGGLKSNSFDDIKMAIDVFDKIRPLGHISKIQLIKGDATKTIPEFLEKNKHLVTALLYLDFDIYTPTKTAIESFIKTMPKGSMIVFDELNIENWPGETIAVSETLGINNLRIKRFNFFPQISYAVIE